MCVWGDVRVACFHSDVYGMTWVWLVSSGYLLCVEPLQWRGHQPNHSHSQNKEARSQEICRQMCLQPRLKVSKIINVFFLIASFNPAFHLFLLSLLVCWQRPLLMAPVRFGRQLTSVCGTLSKGVLKSGCGTAPSPVIPNISSQVSDNESCLLFTNQADLLMDGHTHTHTHTHTHSLQ